MDSRPDEQLRQASVRLRLRGGTVTGAPGGPSSDWTVRPLRWDDFEDLVSIYYAAYAERDRGVPIGITLFGSRPSRSDEVEWFSGLYRRTLEEQAFVSVAAVDGRVVGSCTIAPVGGLRQGETGHVGELGILVGEPYRGRGVGSALLHHALDGAVGRFEQVRLSVFADNDRARRLYARHGFVPCGHIPRMVKRGDRYGDIEIMILDLAARSPTPAAKG